VKVGLVHYSKTGHTKSVIEDIALNILKDEHDTVLLPLELASPWDASADRLPLKKLPDVQGFDCLIVGTPVHGGRMAGAVRTFLEEIEGLIGKEVVFLLTNLFWQGWGADQTIQQMRELCTAKGADVLGYGNVRWLGFKRNKRIQQAERKVIELLKD